MYTAAQNGGTELCSYSSLFVRPSVRSMQISNSRTESCIQFEVDKTLYNAGNWIHCMKTDKNLDENDENWNSLKICLLAEFLCADCKLDWV